MGETEGDKYYFDDEAADAVVNFIEKNLLIVEGEGRGQPFVLLDWQRKITRDIFGWKVKATGRRRYKTVYVEIPKKNGKTPWLGALSVACLFMERDKGGKVVSVATKRDQAAKIYDNTAEMITTSPTLRKYLSNAKETATSKRKLITVYKNPKKIVVGSAQFVPLSADAGTEDGANVSFVFIDELHRASDGEMFNLMKGSMIARPDAMMVTITTAGDDLEGVCWKQHEYAEQVSAGLIKDDTFYGVIYGAGKDDDPFDERTWRKANPGIGTVISIEDFRSLAKQAQQQPSYRYDFLRFHLNVWNLKRDTYLPDELWMASAGEVDAASLLGKPCYVGVDLASREDFSAVVQLFPADGGYFDVLPHFWICRDAVREHPQGETFVRWADAGLVNIVEGNATDPAEIEAFVLSLKQHYPIRQAAFDPKDAFAVIARCNSEGIEAISVPQNHTNLHPGMVTLERLVLKRRLRHGGNPVLRWMNSNMVPYRNRTGLVMPDRLTRTAKIDGMAALVMAVGRAAVQEEPKETTSIYDLEDRGLLIF